MEWDGMVSFQTEPGRALLILRSLKLSVSPTLPHIVVDAITPLTSSLGSYCQKLNPRTTDHPSTSTD